MIAPSTPGFITCEPDHIYRQKSKDNLGSHALADFRRCPWLFHKKELGLIADEDRPAYLVGRAAHTLILEGRQRFAAEYAVGGPINPRTGSPFGSNTKAFREWADAQGKPVLTDDQNYLIEQMAAGIDMNSVAIKLLATGVPEGVVRTRYIDTPCQTRMDWFSSHDGIVDLKTCDDLTWFEADARRYGYVHQMAFYRAVLCEVAGERYPVHIIAVEKREPFRCGVWRVGEDVLGIAEKENEEAMRRLQRCRERGEWPTGYEDVRVFDYL